MLWDSWFIGNSKLTSADVRCVCCFTCYVNWLTFGPSLVRFDALAPFIEYENAWAEYSAFLEFYFYSPKSWSCCWSNNANASVDCSLIFSHSKRLNVVKQLNIQMLWIYHLKLLNISVIWQNAASPPQTFCSQNERLQLCRVTNCNRHLTLAERLVAEAAKRSPGNMSVTSKAVMRKRVQTINKTTTCREFCPQCSKELKSVNPNRNGAQHLLTS